MESKAKHDHSNTLDTIAGGALLVVFIVLCVYGSALISSIECARGVAIECVN